MPRDTPYAGVASLFRSALEHRQAPRVLEDGGQLRDFVHVDDVARANVLALADSVSVHGPLNIASGTPRTVLDLARALSRAFAPDAPGPRVAGGYRLGDVRHVFASTGAARRRLGFEARVPFDEGIAGLVRRPLAAG
jgi:dTDP-L-rhamnose 4-epimerase